MIRLDQIAYHPYGHSKIYVSARDFHPLGDCVLHYRGMLRVSLVLEQASLPPSLSLISSARSSGARIPMRKVVSGNRGSVTEVLSQRFSHREEQGRI